MARLPYADLTSPGAKPLVDRIVQATPPPNAPAPNAHAPAPDAPDAPDAHKPAGAGESVEVIGYSLAYSFEEAMHDAINQARARFPAPPRNPDVGVRVEVIQIYSSAGGNIRPGLFIKAKAQ